MRTFKRLLFLVFILLPPFYCTSGLCQDLSALYGSWGHQIIGRHVDGSWHTEANKTTLNSNGSGVSVYKYNNNGILTSGTENFTYTLDTNADGSFTIWYTPQGESVAEPSRFILSDDGDMIIGDGTDDSARQELEILIKLDTTKQHADADLIGDSYMIGYEHDAQGGDSGYYRASSHTGSADGNGTFSFTSGKLNGDGTLHDDTGSAPYTVNSDGSVAIFGTGYLSDKLFMSSNTDNTDDWENNFAFAKGDRAYATTDLEGTWAFTGFGDYEGTYFHAEIGTMTCNSAGSCTFSLKGLRSDGSVNYISDTQTLSVQSDGSFGLSIPGAISYAGAMGNDGNTLIINRSFDPASLNDRDIVVAVKCSTCSDLAGDPPLASVSGHINCNDFAPGLGELRITAYDGPHKSTSNLLQAIVISKENVTGTSIAYTLAGLPANSYVYISSRWDKDDDGVKSPADYHAHYIANPLLVQSEGDTNIDITLKPGVPQYTASGTYTYNSDTLTLNTSSSDFVCEGLDAGTPEVFTVTWQSATEIMLDSYDDQSTWTRDSGSSGDLNGTWLTVEGPNSYEITFNGSEGAGTFELTGTIAECDWGGDEPETYSVWTGVSRSMTDSGTIDTNILHFHLWAPTGTIKQVEASGPGLLSPVTFTQYHTYPRGEVIVDDFSQDILITTNPVVGDVYNFIVTKTDDSTVNSSQTIGEVILDAPLVASPTTHELADANLGATLNFNYTLPSGITKNDIMINGGVCTSTGGESVSGTVVDATSGTIILPNPAGVVGAYINMVVHHGDHVYSKTKYDFGTCDYAQDTEPPSAPTKLRANAVSQFQVDLSWTASTDNIGVEGYKVYRDETEIGMTATPSFSDSNLSANTSYCYTVTAYDRANNFSGSSGQACATTFGPFFAHSYHQSPTDGYFIFIFADDPETSFNAVSISGPGLTGDEPMVYNEGNGRWEIPSIPIGTTLPTESRTYNFTATPASGGDPIFGSVIVSVYVEKFAADLQPTGDVATAMPTFSWTGFAEASYYAVVVEDLSNNWIWSSPNLDAPQTSATYDGPPLTVGRTYLYTVISSINTDGNSNSSFADAQFTYTGSPAKIGDINMDGNVDVSDAILVLQVLSGMNPPGVLLTADVDGDNRIGLSELIYILQYMTGLQASP